MTYVIKSYDIETGLWELVTVIPVKWPMRLVYWHFLWWHWTRCKLAINDLATIKEARRKVYKIIHEHSWPCVRVWEHTGERIKLVYSDGQWR